MEILEKNMRLTSSEEDKSVTKLTRMRKLHYHGLGDREQLTYVEAFLQNKKFRFQSREDHPKLDLHNFGDLDLSTISKDSDIDALESNLKNIIFSSLTEDDLTLYDSKCFVQLFGIAQFTIEYLINIQQVLSSDLNSFARRYSLKKKEVERLAVINKEQVETIKTFRKLKDKCVSPTNENSASTTYLSNPSRISEDRNDYSVQESFLDALDSDETRSMFPNSDHRRGKIHIYVISEDRGSFTEVSVHNNLTVQRLKEEISKKQDYLTKETSDMKLTLKGSCLSDSNTLYHSGVKDESILMLKFESKNNGVTTGTIRSLEVNDSMNHYHRNGMDQRLEKLENATVSVKNEILGATKLLKDEIKRSKYRESAFTNEFERRFRFLEQSLKSEVHREVSFMMNRKETMSFKEKSFEEHPCGVGDLESDDDDDSSFGKTPNNQSAVLDSHFIQTNNRKQKDESSHGKFNNQPEETPRKVSNIKGNKKSLNRLSKKEDHIKDASNEKQKRKIGFSSESEDVSALSDFSEEFSVAAAALGTDGSILLPTKMINEHLITAKPSLKIDCSSSTIEKSSQSSKLVGENISNRSIESSNSMRDNEREIRCDNFESNIKSETIVGTNHVLDESPIDYRDGHTYDSKPTFNFDVSSESELHNDSKDGAPNSCCKNYSDIEDLQTLSSRERSKTNLTPCQENFSPTKRKKKKTGNSSKRESLTQPTKRNKIIHKFVGALKKSVKKKNTS